MKSGEPESQSKFQPSDPEGYVAMDRELQRNHFESFSLRFEIPGEPERSKSQLRVEKSLRESKFENSQTIDRGSSEVDLSRQIIQRRSQASDRPK
jgi:hypothetical protein